MNILRVVVSSLPLVGVFALAPLDLPLWTAPIAGILAAWGGIEISQWKGWSR